ncbi:MAG TPA: hypothetical protein VN329_16565 [Roseomonas sp.]|nr:hypothetical protein [Roseomonas sp.]
MSLKDDVSDFLKHSREVRYLNFEAFGYRFSPGQYALIAEKIDGGEIPVRNSRVLPMSDGAGASWKYGLNEFWFLPECDLTKDYWRALLAHEGTHSVHDMLNPGKIDTAIAESIGYIAEAIALHAQGNNPIGMKGGGVDPMRAEAMRVVQAMWDPTGLHQMLLSAADAESIRGIVAAHPHTLSQGATIDLSGLH